MAQRFKEGDKVSLRIEKPFSNPKQTLPVGSVGVVLLRLSDKKSYRIQFKDRIKFSVINDADLN